MKVVLASPNIHQQRGNTVTVKRIADGLEAVGVQTEILSVTTDPAIASCPDADLIHGFHAYKFYAFQEKLQESKTPYIITMTGTDLNHDLFNEERRKKIAACLNKAGAITVFDKAAKKLLSNEIQGIQHKIHVIHQGTSDLPSGQTSIQKEDGTFLFLLPAGIRAVKNIPFAIDALKKLHQKHPHIRLLLVGPVIEQTEGKQVLDLVEENAEWITYAGQLPHSQMGGPYEQADIVLNTSHTEGQPASLLEAMEHELPVIAYNNSGNRTIVSHGKTGFIYNNESEFLEYAMTLLNNSEMRKIFGKAGKSYILEEHSREYEARKFLAIYQQVLNENTINEGVK
jgi:glycosyltransferase involved in cell wall biosynthesis